MIIANVQKPEHCDNCHNKRHYISYVNNSKLYVTGYEKKWLCSDCWNKYIEPRIEEVKANWGALGVTS